MANLTGRTYVASPTLTPSKAGLLNAIKPVEINGTALLGVTFETNSGIGLNAITENQFSCEDQATRSFEDGRDFVDSDEPFTLWRGYQCNPLGTDQSELLAKAEQSLELGEGHAVERHLWEVSLPSYATVLGGGTAVKPKKALGLLLEWAGQNYAGTPYIHAGRLASVYLAAEQLLDPDENEAATVGGGILVNGSGYYSRTGPGAVTLTGNEYWMYVTAGIVIYRSSVDSRVVRKYDTNDQIAEAVRHYVPAVEPVVAAVKVVLD